MYLNQQIYRKYKYLLLNVENPKNKSLICIKCNWFWHEISNDINVNIIYLHMERAS